jgi:hypothetical protein
MAQTSIGVYAGEQIAGFLLKMVGTLVGLVVGACTKSLPVMQEMPLMRCRGPQASSPGTSVPAV